MTTKGQLESIRRRAEKRAGPWLQAEYDRGALLELVDQIEARNKSLSDETYRIEGARLKLQEQVRELEAELAQTHEDWVSSHD